MFLFIFLFHIAFYVVIMGVVHEHEQYEDNSDPLDYDNYEDTY